MKQEFDMEVTEDNIYISSDKDQGDVCGVEDYIRYVFFVEYSSVDILKIDNRTDKVIEYRKGVNLWNI